MTNKLKYSIFFLCFLLVFSSCLPALEEIALEKDTILQKHSNFLSLGLFSSADSIKTSVNLELGLTIFSNERFQLRSLTAITGAKVYDDEPNLYQLGLMEKLSFGQVDAYTGGISAARYGFCFASFGFMSFDRNGASKFLFSPPYYWEVGGGAGVNIRMSKMAALVAEVGGGLHLVPEDGFLKKLRKAGFGRMSLGFRYFL